MRRFLFFSGFQPRKEEDSGHGWLVGAVSVPIGSGGFRSSHGLSPHEARHDSFPQRPLPLQRVAGKLSQASHHSNLFKENEGQLRTKRQLLVPLRLLRLKKNQHLGLIGLKMTELVMMEMARMYAYNL